MKSLARYLGSIILFQLLSFVSFAQETPPFYTQIEEFKKADLINPPAKNQIVFVGSSSFTKWKDVQSYFPEYQIINRGFGGSSLPDVIRYAKDVILPYHPKQVVIYCGENDFMADGVDANIVFDRFTTLFKIIREALPKAQISFVSLKPSPSRAKYMPEMTIANEMIKNYLKSYKRTDFIDVYSKMLLADGSPMPEIFEADRLHMNANGYKIWQKEIGPYLKK